MEKKPWTGRSTATLSSEALGQCPEAPGTSPAGCLPHRGVATGPLPWTPPSGFLSLLGLVQPSVHEGSPSKSRWETHLE